MRAVSLVSRVLVSLILTYVMLYIARNTSRGHPESITHAENGFTFEMTTVPKGPENGKARLDLNIKGRVSESLHPVIHFFSGTDGDRDPSDSRIVVPLVLSDSTTGAYFTQINCGPRGDRRFYSFEIRDNKDKVIASFMQPNGAPFETRYIGEVPKPVLIGHIFFMFATVFCVAMGATQAVSALLGKSKIRVAATFITLAAAFTLLGGYPYGFAMNHYAFGGLWEGVPFGTDATDNKTQLLLIYLLMVAFGGLGTVAKGRFGRDVFSKSALAIFSIIAFFLMLGIYLIPHSIQFSAATTYAVCYSFIGLCALIYLTGYLRTRKA